MYVYSYPSYLFVGVMYVCMYVCTIVYMKYLAEHHDELEEEDEQEMPEGDYTIQVRLPCSLCITIASMCIV
jgi:hypothetical protein